VTGTPLQEKILSLKPSFDAPHLKYHHNFFFAPPATPKIPAMCDTSHSDADIMHHQKPYLDDAVHIYNDETEIERAEAHHTTHHTFTQIILLRCAKKSVIFSTLVACSQVCYLSPSSS
jgi:hypothetical protein